MARKFLHDFAEAAEVHISENKQDGGVSTEQVEKLIRELKVAQNGLSYESFKQLFMGTLAHQVACTDSLIWTLSPSLMARKRGQHEAQAKLSTIQQHVFKEVPIFKATCSHCQQSTLQGVMLCIHCIRAIHKRCLTQVTFPCIARKVDPQMVQSIIEQATDPSVLGTVVLARDSSGVFALTPGCAPEKVKAAGPFIGILGTGGCLFLGNNRAGTLATPVKVVLAGVLNFDIGGHTIAIIEKGDLLHFFATAPEPVDTAKWHPATTAAVSVALSADGKRACAALRCAEVALFALHHSVAGIQVTRTKVVPLPGRQIPTTIAMGQGQTLLACSDSGLAYRLEHKYGTISPINTESAPSVKAVITANTSFYAVDRRGRLWANAEQGLSSCVPCVANLASVSCNSDTNVATTEHGQMLAWGELACLTRGLVAHTAKITPICFPHFVLSASLGDGFAALMVIKVDPLCEVDIGANPSSIVDMSQLKTVWKWIPPRFRILEPSLLFTTAKDGYSLGTLFSKCEDQFPLLILIRSAENNIFGAFISEPLQTDASSFYGTGETFVFTVSPKPKSFTWVQGTECEHCVLSTTGEMLALGASGKEGASFALHVDASLHGSSSRSITFANEPLNGEEHATFTCAIVEVLSVQ
eukprot:TRINITY_DN5716_c0_g1_i1.p1 TRINITY_DN5716_c0_g1~~TRINITY_DN5716_c0_g1_i1.p1  ORF type:complete len:691 (-),score=139.07 TRINITY_DN5716_c0_g1_i1:63-1985(-)